MKNNYLWPLTLAILLVTSLLLGSAPCTTCHTKVTPGIVKQWESSKHFKAGIDCADCHGAEEGEPDAFLHNGAWVSIIVSPKDCSQCHEKEFMEQKGSHHAKAAEILGSLDNLLGEVVGGPPAVDAGCRQCHGSAVRVDDQGKPTKETWPNTGMGRINPDGSAGSCSACHARHEFSAAQARQPEACGKCHLGPDHPQIEVWEESKHGIMYRANRESLNLDKDTWVAGKDYFSGPTCASCHMGAAGNLGVTHDVGERISWTLRPPISTKLNMVIFEDHSKLDIPGDSPELPAVDATFKGKKVTAFKTWEDRRDTMKTVCNQCHSKEFTSGAYDQFDGVVDLYNTKFALPARSIISELKFRKIISEPDFDDPIEWTWWELWHHEGRRARHGAAMQGPDYTWWHGMYEVGKHFYEKFIPQLKEVAGEETAKELLDKYVYSQEGHQWHRDGMGKEALQKIQKFYSDRYKQ
ncbi:MAG TPA: multiheme c-type cytochrome [Thermoanaerobaculia bacterium]|nr:multiheme c-type cytochrome [Thermoanaerobaculia bacterium]HUM29739.1 multiheme c-type cytochrome [Thermoanaerobaculia bacterium]HXK67039.1 multiheme c-type cytochrome [Thermoanaerobaculia bacterium]